MTTTPTRRARSLADVERERITIQGRLAAACRQGDKDAERELRAAHKAVMVERAILRAVDEAPPLTDAARLHLADLLRSGVHQ